MPEAVIKSYHRRIAAIFLLKRALNAAGQRAQQRQTRQRMNQRRRQRGEQQRDRTA